MNDAPQNVNVGIAGSITMVVLCLGVTFLCISFYRRYKRAERGDFQLGEMNEGEQTPGTQGATGSIDSE
jgi:hypothetical protein